MKRPFQLTDLLARKHNRRHSISVSGLSILVIVTSVQSKEQLYLSNRKRISFYCEVRNSI